MTQTICILIADDHAIVREGVRAFINGQPDMKLVGEARDGAEAIRLADALKPDVILMDLVMPLLSGLEAIQAIRRKNPQARILVLTSFSEEDQVVAAVRAGALGYLLKDASPPELLEAIRCVYRGESSLQPAVAHKLLLRISQSASGAPEGPALSEREVEVLKLVAQGLSNPEIAARLFIGEGTVRFHLGNLLNKLGLANRTQAALYALRQGLAHL